MHCPGGGVGVPEELRLAPRPLGSGRGAESGRLSTRSRAAWLARSGPLLPTATSAPGSNPIVTANDPGLRGVIIGAPIGALIGVSSAPCCS